MWLISNMNDFLKYINVNITGDVESFDGKKGHAQERFIERRF